MSELVTIKSSHSGIELRLNAKLPFPDLLKAVEEKFRQSADFFKNAKMAVSFSGRTLSISEEEQLIQVITQTTNLEIICIIDHDERKELIYKRAVAQCLSEREKSDGQFYRGTLKRRQLLESESSIVILGDVEFGAKVVAKGPALAYERMKRLVNRQLYQGLEDAMENEGEYQYQLCKSEDHAEAIHAFFEKRKPDFKGR